MPVLVRYCLMAFWPPFLLATGTWVFILNLLFYLREFLDYLLVYQAGVWNSCRLLLFIQPSFLVLAIPIGFLTAVLVVYGRMSADREVTAVEACGTSLWVLVWPMIGLSFLCSIFLVAFMDSFLPWGNASFLKLQYQIITERSAVIVRERVFIKDFDGFILYVDQKDDKRDILKNVKVLVLNEKGYPYRTIFAKEGALRQDPSNYHVILDLSTGEMQQLGTHKSDSMAEFFSMQFKTCALDLSARRLSGGGLDLRNAQNTSSILELARKIKQEEAAKQDARNDEVDFQKRFSIPFSALAFAFIGIPLGLMARTGSFTSTFLAVVLVAIYEGFIMFGQAGGPMGVVSPLLAMWLPNGILACVGLALLSWLNHRNHFWQNLAARFFHPNAPATATLK